MKKSTEETIILAGLAAVGGYALMKYVAEPALETVKSQLRMIPIIGAALGGPGANASTSSRFAVSILDPMPNTSWGIAFQHSAKVAISSQNNSALKVFCGMSIERPNGTIQDFPVQEMTFNSGETKEISWPVSGHYKIFNLPIQWNFGMPVITFPDMNFPPGLYRIRISVWRIFPTPQTATEEDRIGDSDWISFSFGVI